MNRKLQSFLRFNRDEGRDKHLFWRNRSQPKGRKPMILGLPKFPEVVEEVLALKNFFRTMTPQLCLRSLKMIPHLLLTFQRKSSLENVLHRQESPNLLRKEVLVLPSKWKRTIMSSRSPISIPCLRSKRHNSLTKTFLTITNQTKMPSKHLSKLMNHLNKRERTKTKRRKLRMMTRKWSSKIRITKSRPKMKRMRRMKTTRSSKMTK